MLEQDYLMRILLQFAEAIRRSWARSVGIAIRAMPPTCWSAP